ncbi:bifunctional adenosylcobinamide kinase/adenosylcobinamide-phosphate guanylyltransferase [Alphaproteobacteria bacterium GH1-50]|uniref:Bifunctional adenosylcobalamin biosynthesis protein n=1 Tax=Kangsaoukella pontilimi TaxID=2691042 RepID=A0A7C9IHG0_9RHOB|nr:bifunctional adenosylcobinamide kinase/adenosylcobinamide-phosphate guanylyltransferase [Kangsaoukella pontilimi]MXQ09044.1 bifunctional adenosylcobinamide kinase/adenosylcobinamide-phosphate guanylyltransferase [Kangsaoukella pontilimi]
MGKSILVTGGANSGKSALAERLTLGRGASPVYIATSQAHDDEMRAKIARHRASRGPGWTTIEAPTDIVTALRDSDGAAPRLVDCLTMWLTNLMLSKADWQAEADALTDLIPTLESPVVFVTNEVGAGIVPENRLARQFRSAAGQLNQQVAACCDEVWLSVSGCPLRIKPHE